MSIRNGTVPNSTINVNDDRSLWKTIRNTNVTSKVKTFTWKLTTNSIVVQANRCRRLPNLLPPAIYSTLEDETSFHATMSCSKAKALRQGLPKPWNLPPDFKLQYT
jgi:hypothetical protein